MRINYIFKIFFEIDKPMNQEPTVPPQKTLTWTLMNSSCDSHFLGIVQRSLTWKRKGTKKGRNAQGSHEILLISDLHREWKTKICTEKETRQLSFLSLDVLSQHEHV